MTTTRAILVITSLYWPGGDPGTPAPEGTFPPGPRDSRRRQPDVDGEAQLGPARPQDFLR